MQRIIRLLVCLFGTFGALMALAQAPNPLPVQGNLSSIIGNGQQYAGVSIQLQNCASPVSIAGYSVIVQQGYQVMANGAGLVNTTVWPNDIITCNGTTGNSQYQLSYTANGAVQGTPQCYQVVHTQGTWNLNAQQPIRCSQTPPNPQDAQYRNLNVTGCLSVDGYSCNVPALPLSGGTLTGPLNGTTAAFTGGLAANAIAAASSYTGPSFTIAVFPDIQNMTDPGNASSAEGQGVPAQFADMVNYVIANKTALNIVAVAGVGDDVNAGVIDSSRTPGPGWAASSVAWGSLLASGIAVSPAIGNHDYDSLSNLCGSSLCASTSVPPTNRAATQFLANLGPSVLAGHSWYKGYDSAQQLNQWISFTSGGQQYGIIALDYCPNPHDVSWAAGIISANPTIEFMINVHSYLGMDSKPMPQTYYDGLGDSIGCGAYTELTDGPEGGALLWTNLVSQYANVWGVVSGHVLTGKTQTYGAYQNQTGVNGNSVAAIYGDYQAESPNAGVLRLITVYPTLGYLSVKTYATSPNEDTTQAYFLTDPTNQFTLPLFGGPWGGIVAPQGTVASQTIQGTAVQGTTVQGQTVTAASSGPGTGGASSVVLSPDGSIDSIVYGNVTNPAIGVTEYDNGATAVSPSDAFIFQRAGGTPDNPLAVTNGQSIFTLAARGWDGTEFSSPSPASIRLLADGTFVHGTNWGTKWVFSGTPSGSTTLNTDTMDLDGSGNLKILGSLTLRGNVTGYTGTCAASTTLTVVDGIITGCN